MAATVTIDKAYFETLLRRAEFHTEVEKSESPVKVPTITISKDDHESLLRMAREYTNLREALYKEGIEPATLEMLVRDGNFPSAPEDSFTEDNKHGSGGVELFTRPKKTEVTMTRLANNEWATSVSNRSPSHAGDDHRGHSNSKTAFSNRHYGSTQEDDTSWDPELDKDDALLAIPRLERKRYAREEQRTIIVKNLSDRTTHKDIVNFLRGGMVLDIYLRLNDHSASISFVEGSTAHEFMNYIKRNDVYLHGKRLEFTWNDRQFIMPGHVANKINIGATRNLVIRKIHPNITESRIREDLDHIHNLVIVEFSLQNGDAKISINSIHNALFARNCMMSRAMYKGTKIEWYPDECAQPLPKTRRAPKKENIAPPPTKKSNAMLNRFQMLNMYDDETEDGSEEGEILPTLSSLNINQSQWSSPTVAA